MKILFICEGNTCRSYMAEIIASQNINGIEFYSAGYNVDGSKRNKLAIQVLNEHFPHLKIKESDTNKLSETKIDDFDFVIPLTNYAYNIVTNLKFAYPTIMESWEIYDPWKMPIGQYEKTFDQLLTEINKLKKIIP